MLHSALKEFVKEPLADGTWKKVVKCLSLKDVDADGVLTRDEEAVILHFLPTQSLSSKELKSICEGLRKANVFGPSSLASFYELCLNLGQTSIVRSAVESSDALSEQCIAMFLNFVAGESEDKDDHLLPSLLTRRFDPRRMANAAARRVTTQNASVLMRKCMDIYVSPKHGDIAEQVSNRPSIPQFEVLSK
ncbi:unnamed protein product [Heligmosomoides polygyrus]|uniref:EF-hand domain-containing protein n=1 Tax=Heligmosomoides polygyrus TaxID=6339 RepID=A0A183GDT0_HELPZ|nr:unnamed protein product [Heligmosomoides polygyrus]